MSGYVLDDDRGPGLAGSVQLLWGKRSAWIRLWVDTNNPDPHNARLLLEFALQRIDEAPHVNRAYIGVRAYQTGLNAHLSDYGFAPFTDRMLMVRNILQWQRRTVDHRIPKLETVREAVPGSLAIPEFRGRRPRPSGHPSTTSRLAAAKPSRPALRRSQRPPALPPDIHPPRNRHNAPAGAADITAIQCRSRQPS